MNKMQKEFGGFIDDSRWLVDHYESIKNKYTGKAFAVKNKKIIAVKEDVIRLKKYLVKKGIDPEDVLIDFIPEEEVVYIL